MKKPLLLSVALFEIACCLPALAFKQNQGGDDVAFELGMLVGGWYANPFWALGLLLGAFRKRIRAIVCGTLAVPVVLTVLPILA
jgi:hypothetical protein